MSPAVFAAVPDSRVPALTRPDVVRASSIPAASGDTLVAETLPAMCSSNALTRTQSTHRLERSLPLLPPSDFQALAAAISERMKALRAGDEWQLHAGTLLAAVHVVPFQDTLHEDAQFGALVAITHAEPRVRAVASALLSAVAQARGAAAWGCVPTLVGVVQARFAIGEDARLAEAGRVAAREAGERAAGQKLHGVSIVHETEGWRGLETALLALRGVVDGCGGAVFADAAAPADIPGLPEIVGYVARAPSHENRFVREAGLRLLNALIAAAQEQLLAPLAAEGLSALRAGLVDNWSQVRYAATVATHALLSAVGDDARRAFYPALLPRMCLNRHYVAEGVRTLAQATWTEVIGADGREHLRRLLPDVVAFYKSQCAADNHAVREAACQSIGEVATKLRQNAVEHVPEMLAALTECFKDESWPVRDHACRALASVISAFPLVADRTGRLPELYALFRAHLADNIPSVRANCAEALVLAAAAFPPEHATIGLRRVAADARALLARAPAQDAHPTPAGAPDRHTGYGAAAKLARDNDPALHTGQVMYSCGSLAPKLRRGGGCMDHGFSRPKQPWEEADGGARLWRRVAASGNVGAALAAEAIPDVAEAVRCAAEVPFAHQMAFAEGMCTEIAAGAGLAGRGAEWAEKDVQTLAGAVERLRKCGHKRVQTAAAEAARCLRAAVGFGKYNAAVRAAKEAASA